MADAFSNSSARLQELLERVMKEKDPEKHDELAAEINRVLKERQTLRKQLGLKTRAED